MPAPTPHLAPKFALLTDRAVIEMSGPDWRGFLQGLITQDVETLEEGEARFAALLTPQGRVLFDLFVIGRDGGCLIDCAAARREALIQRLALYRLRARVAIAPSALSAAALWEAPSAPTGWLPDPRLAALGWRGYGVAVPTGAVTLDLAAYDAHRLTAGAPGPEDWGEDRTYPIEANFDLLGGIDFKKGCFVGQETTSRMKRRGTVKTRMALIGFEGPAPAHGAELLSGELRAGEVLSGKDGLAIALVRLDRLAAGDLRLTDGRRWRVVRTVWGETPGA